MSTAFYMFVNVMVPVSALFLLLLLVPFPPSIRRPINNMMTKVFLIPGPLGLSTISSVLIVLTFFFGNVAYQLYDYTSKYSHDVVKHEPPKISLSEHRLVRAQRNFWVGMLLMVFWSVLYMLLKLSKRLVEQEAELSTYRNKTAAPKKVAEPVDSTKKHVVHADVGHEGKVEKREGQRGSDKREDKREDKHNKQHPTGERSDTQMRSGEEGVLSETKKGH